MNKILKYLKHFDIALFVIYSLGISVFIPYWDTPKLYNELLPFILTGIFLFLLICSYYLTSKKLHLSFESFKLPKKSKTYEILCALTLLLAIAVFISWGITFQEHSTLIQKAPSYGLRLITTSLHKLVPIESRLFHTVLPFLIIFPTKEKKWKGLMFFLFLFIGFATQTKISYFYLSFISIVYIFQNIKSLKIRMFLSLLSLATFSGGLYYTSQGSFGFYEIQKELKQIASSSSHSKTSKKIIKNKTGRPTLAGHTCQGIGPFKLNTSLSQKRFLDRIFSRVFILPSEMARLFTCLGEHGVYGHFKGHQLAKLTGSYFPYYEEAYREFRPAFESLSTNSARTTIIFDSFANGSYLVVILSALICGLLMAFLNLFLKDLTFIPLVLFLKLNFLYGMVTSSLPTTLIFLAPAIGFIIIEKTSRKVFRKSEVPSHT